MVYSRLNTFLDLKIENQRLQQRLRELTGQSPVEPAAATSNRYPPSLPLYTSTSLTVGGAFDEPTQTPATARGTIDALYTTGTLTERNEDEDGGKKKKVGHPPLFSLRLAKRLAIGQEDAYLGPVCVYHLWEDGLARVAQRTAGAQNVV